MVSGAFAAAISVALTILISWLFYDNWWGVLLFPFVYFLIKKLCAVYLEEKRKNSISHAFKEMLEVLCSFLQTGSSLENAFLQTENQLRHLGLENKELLDGLGRMNQLILVNVPVEKACLDFTRELNIEEADAFADILIFAKRIGGNYGKNIRQTSEKLGEKLSLYEEIDAMMAEKKLEMRIMLVIPVVIMIYVRLTSRDLMEGLYHNLLGQGIMTACLLVYAAMALLAKKMVRIEI